MASPRPPVVGDSWFFGAARDLRRDQLGTYRRALDAHRGELVRFRVGRRGCIGQHLAMAELVVVIATVVRAFRLESIAEKPCIDVGATLRPCGELPCRVRSV